MSQPRDVFDTATLHRFSAIVTRDVRHRLLQPGSLEAVIQTIYIAQELRSALKRVGLTEAEIDAALHRFTADDEAAGWLRGLIRERADSPLAAVAVGPDKVSIEESSP